MIYLNDHIDSLDIEESLALVSKQRRQEALRYRQINGQRQSLAVYLLLCEALEKEYGIVERPEFSFGEHGKPFLADHADIHFNFSHCRRAVLCVVDSVPVGCDIEAVPEKLDMDLCRCCFNDEEVDAIISSPSPTIAFTELWTRKEAFLKLTGEGLTDNLPAVLAAPLAQKASFSTHISPDHSYVYTICKRGRKLTKC